MKHYWTKIELEKSWSLSPGDLGYLTKKENPLIYALKMKYFDLAGYLPKKIEDIPAAAIEYVAAQLSLPDQGNTQAYVKRYDWQSRTSQRHNTEIREYYGFRKLEPDDLAAVKKFIETELLPQGLSVGQVRDEVYKFLNNIDPFAQRELNKQISAICSQYTNRFFTQCRDHLSPHHQQNLHKLLEMYDEDQTILNFMRTPAGKVSSTTIHEEQEKLSYIEAAGVIDQEFFNHIPRKFLKMHHDKVAISTPSQLLVIKKSDSRKFLSLTACFAKYKGAKILDSFIEILVKKLRKLEHSGKEKLKEELWKYYTREDKDELLDSLVDASLAYPDGIIKETIYPEVGGKEKLEQSKLSHQAFKQARRESEYKHLRSLYVQG